MILTWSDSKKYDIEINKAKAHPFRPVVFFLEIMENNRNFKILQYEDPTLRLNPYWLCHFLKLWNCVLIIKVNEKREM